MRVLLVTTWNIACGIAEHSAMLKEHVEEADPAITVDPRPDALDPSGSWLRKDRDAGRDYDLIHLNYHGALHGAWSADVVRRAREITQLPIVVTYHDTGVPNSDNCKAVVDAADAAVVHEPCDDLPLEKARYWRMGVETAVAPLSPFRLTTKGGRPVLGTIGFPFAWKNFDRIVAAAVDAGWAALLFAPGATQAQIDGWMDLSPQIFVRAQFVPRLEAIQWLGACDATAFCYHCAFTGQSGSVLHGIAARKPVFAFHRCRQFRALRLDPLGSVAIRWVEDFPELTRELRALPIVDAIDPPTAALAEQDSWTRLGEKYADLYRSLVHA